MLAHRAVELPARRGGGVLAQREAERGVADGAGHHDEVALARAGAANHGAVRHGAERRDIDRDGAGAAVGVAAEQRATVMRGVLAQPFSEGFEPIGRQTGRQADRHQEAERRRALRREIGQVDAQRPPRHRVGGIVGKEMHPADDAVGGQHEIASRRRRDDGGVIGETQGAGMGRDRPEIRRDQAVLARAFVGCRHDLLPARLRAKLRAVWVFAELSWTVPVARMSEATSGAAVRRRPRRPPFPHVAALMRATEVCRRTRTPRRAACGRAGRARR